MRRILIYLTCLALACSGTDPVNPEGSEQPPTLSPVQPPVAVPAPSAPPPLQQPPVPPPQEPPAEPSEEPVEDPRTCREVSDVCVPIVYDLKLVDGKPIPVKSPWGHGEWDYDSDAGTYMLAETTLSLFQDGGFDLVIVIRAASGFTIIEKSVGSYLDSAGSLQLTGIDGGRWSASIAGETLTLEWPWGMTFTFRAR